MKKIAVLLTDYVIIFGAIILSFIILKNSVLLNYSNNIGAFYYVSPAIVVIYIILSYVFGMYTLRNKSIGEIVYTVSIVSVALTICIMAACFFIRESAVSYPRSVILLSSILYFAGLALWRASLRIIYIRKHGNKDIMIVGSDNNALINRFQNKYKQLYSVKYVCDERDATLLQKATEVSEIFIATDVSAAVREQLFLLPVEHKNISVYFIPNINDIAIINARLHMLDDIPTHVFSKMHLTEEEKLVKRGMDIFIAIILLIITLPLFIFLPILIMLDGGTVMYRQERFTRDHKVFNILKFRTMIPNAEELSGPVLAEDKDKRITRIGRFLRATRLDELPQIFNILAGDMSMVGPRPERPFFTEKIEAAVPEFKYRLNVKAGLTGMAQVMGRYNTNFSQKLYYDIYYINHFSIFRDILILLQTIRILFMKDNAKGLEQE